MRGRIEAILTPQYQILTVLGAIALIALLLVVVYLPSRRSGSQAQQDAAKCDRAPDDMEGKIIAYHHEKLGVSLRYPDTLSPITYDDVAVFVFKDQQEIYLREGIPLAEFMRLRVDSIDRYGSIYDEIKLFDEEIIGTTTEGVYEFVQSFADTMNGEAFIYRFTIDGRKRGMIIFNSRTCADSTLARMVLATIAAK